MGEEKQGGATTNSSRWWQCGKRWLGLPVIGIPSLERAEIHDEVHHGDSEALARRAERHFSSAAARRESDGFRRSQGVEDNAKINTGEKETQLIHARIVMNNTTKERAVEQGIRERQTERETKPKTKTDTCVHTESNKPTKEKRKRKE